MPMGAQPEDGFMPMPADPAMIEDVMGWYQKTGDMLMHSAPEITIESFEQVMQFDATYTARKIAPRAYARVLKDDGSIIPGLYATGNSTASVFGRCYPAAGASTLAEAAQMMGITLQSARTYSKRIFQKTGTRRQAELVRLLLTSTLSLA